MRDELFDREYQVARRALNAGIGNGLDHLGQSMMLAFRTLSAIQFAAPWKRGSKRDGVHCG